MSILMDAPVGVLERMGGPKDAVQAPAEPIYGGYENARGEISLFAETVPYRVNFKNRTVKECRPLNAGAQQRYDDTLPGEQFDYGHATFRRLDHPEILEICTSGSFRTRPKLI